MEKDIIEIHGKNIHFIDPVFGIEGDKNMLISIGLKINRDGLIDIDDDWLQITDLTNTSCCIE